MIFISYRRDDARSEAQSINQRLRRTAGERNVFFDVETELGKDFRAVIEQNLNVSKILIVVIGKHWLDARDSAGNRRLEKEDDWVRLEISTALKRGIQIFPVLVGDAVMPTADALPADLKDFAFRQGKSVRHETFSQDMDVLEISVRKLVRVDPPIGPKIWAPALAAILVIAIAATYLYSSWLRPGISNQGSESGNIVPTSVAPSPPVLHANPSAITPVAIAPNPVLRPPLTSTDRSEAPDDRSGAPGNCNLSFISIHPEPSGAQLIKFDSACGPVSRIYFSYREWTFVRAIDPATEVTVSFDFFAGPSNLKISTDRGGELAVQPVGKDPAGVQRLVLLWEGSINLDLLPDQMVLEPQVVDRFAYQTWTRLADGGNGTKRAVIYTINPKTSLEPHAIKFRVENKSRGNVARPPFCDGHKFDQVEYEAATYAAEGRQINRERQTTISVACGQPVDEDKRAPRLRSVMIRINSQS
jgi:hypothetical protein